MAIKTAEQVRTEFERCGISIADWARRHKLRPFIVYQVLAGTKKGARGSSHRAAVLLGIKEGAVIDQDQFDRQIEERKSAA